METFTLAPVGGWIVRAFGRNPLVRTSDRIEALLLILAVTVALAAAPIAGAIGRPSMKRAVTHMSSRQRVGTRSRRSRSRTAPLPSNRIPSTQSPSTPVLSNGMTWSKPGTA
jgi:hypothetical protein